MDTDFWNDRFGKKEYIYGTEPNEYLKEKLSDLKPGKILFVAEGEGRNSVYAASLGWQVEAFDQSVAGREKALMLAKRKKVALNYKISDAAEINYPDHSFDAMALIYAHFPDSSRRKFHRRVAGFLKPGGVVILEAFSKKQVEKQKINPQAGGPKVLDMLYDLDEVKKDFEGFKMIEATEVPTHLSEGEYHKGEGIVIRIFARKRI